jgi:uncharacterized integral membrane protein
MYLSLIVTFILLMGLVVAAVQNTTPIDFKFLMWGFQMSVTGLIFYAALFGGAMVSLLTLPGLIRQLMRNRSYRRETRELKQRLGRIEKHTESGEK